MATTTADTFLGDLKSFRRDWSRWSGLERLASILILVMAAVALTESMMLA